MASTVTPTTSDLPEDVWRLVISLLPPNQVQKCISVNRTFFHAALDLKYRYVSWIKLDLDFLNILPRLQHPLIAAHVRTMCIRAWFVDYLFKRDALPKKSSPIHSSSVGFIGTLLGRLKQQRSPPTTTIPRGQGAHMILDAMSRAIRGMSQLVELQFEWRDLPLTKDSRAFLSGTINCDRSLRKLVLHAQILKFKELLLITNFPHLHELDFHFDYQTASKDISKGEDDAERKELLETVCSFINHRRTNLRALAISSSSTIDLSDFFNSLPTMPSLRRFAVNIPFDQHHLSNPSGLIRLLKVHSHTLFHVQLTASITSVFLYGDRETILRQKQKAWTAVNKRLLDEPSCLRDLSSLELPFASMEDTDPLLKRSSSTLTRLGLTDHFFTPQEAPLIIDIFNSRNLEVRHIHLEVEVLGSSLIEFLASRLPNLDSLVLVYRECPGSLDLLSSFRESYMPFSDWKLDDIGIYEGRFLPLTVDSIHTTHVSYFTEILLMRRISFRVPSITRWKGFSKEQFRN